MEVRRRWKGVGVEVSSYGKESGFTYAGICMKLIFLDVAHLIIAIHYAYDGLLLMFTIMFNQPRRAVREKSVVL